MKTLREWIQTYEKKAHDPFCIPAGYALDYLPDRGFCSYSTLDEDGIISIWQVCGDGNFWKNMVEVKHEAEGCKGVFCTCVRHIKPWLVAFNFPADVIKRLVLKGRSEDVSIKDNAGRTATIRRDEDCKIKEQYFVRLLFDEKNGGDDMKPKSLAEWIKFYEDKADDTFEVPLGFRLYWLPERGFCSMKPDYDAKMLVIYQVCGDGKFWRDIAEVFVANALGLDTIASICTRAVRPYIRSFNWEIIEEQAKDGKLRFLCQDSVGRAVVLTHKCDGGDGADPHYWVTHYINRKAAASFDEFFKQEVAPNV